MRGCGKHDGRLEAPTASHLETNVPRGALNCLYSSCGLARQSFVLEELLSNRHVHHCGMILMMAPWNTSKSANAVETHSGYGKCAPYSVWSRGMPE